MERQTNYSLLERFSDVVKDCTSVKFLKTRTNMQETLNKPQTKL